ncbi:MAG: tyrosine-type recombinase/integrase [Anaerostipes sp.]|nr:tyrosine-type recombinase/integrase [Anaerostipes sp.]MDD4371904.1 tyrosine-type recombinase/integrase [Anaerostipes sp.]
MPTAKRLPSGSWRCLVYSHNEIKRDKDGNILYDANGNIKKKRIYESFTSNDITKRGKVEAETLANEFILNRKGKKKSKNTNISVLEAIESYIELKKTSLSKSTIEDYESIKKYAFQHIMGSKVKDIDEDMLQEAVNIEAERHVSRYKNTKKKISPKRLKNEYGLLRSSLKRYRKDIDYASISMEPPVRRFKTLSMPETIFSLVNGTIIELPVLLAMWLSFSMSEIRGLTKSKSIDGDYITIVEVIIDTKDGPYRKELAKNEQRNRRHRMPNYIKELIDKVEGDVIVPLSGSVIYKEWQKILKSNNIKHMTFHDLRSVSASVMALLRIPDKYAQERGGWKSDNIMKSVYMQTFSPERIKVDDMIDEYFNKQMQHGMQHKD